MPVCHLYFQSVSWDEAEKEFLMKYLKSEVEPISNACWRKLAEEMNSQFGTSRSGK